jgi:hypothetical protein
MNRYVARLVVVVLLTGVSSWSTVRAMDGTTEWWSGNADSSNRYLVAYPDSGRFLVEEYLIPKTGFQDRVLRKQFETRSSQQQFLKRVLHSRKWLKQSPFQKASGPAEGHLPTTTTPLWVVENQWSAAWEQAYRNWVGQVLDRNFFRRTQFKTDCADVAYILRWVFARDHRLPAANRLIGSGRLFTQNSVRSAWQNLPTAPEWYLDQKFRAAMDYLMDNTFTKTLWNDAYPMLLSSTTFGPGTMFLQMDGSWGHIRVVAHAKQDILLLASTVPRAVRTLYDEYHYDTRFPWVAQNSLYALLNFRWPVPAGSQWTLLSSEFHPDYSLEQFGPELKRLDRHFYRALQIKLGRSVTPAQTLINLSRQMVSLLEQRPGVVNAGFAACGPTPAACAVGSPLYEAHSTPSRDQRFKDTYLLAKEIYRSLPAEQDSAAKSEFERTLERRLEAVPGGWIQLGGFASSLFESTCPKESASDPRQSVDARWCEKISRP